MQPPNRKCGVRRPPLLFGSQLAVASASSEAATAASLVWLGQQLEGSGMGETGQQQLDATGCLKDGEQLLLPSPSGAASPQLSRALQASGRERAWAAAAATGSPSYTHQQQPQEQALPGSIDH